MRQDAVFMHYRSYALPWELAEEQEKTFAKVLQRTLIALLIFAIVVPWLPLPEVDIDKQEEIPERFAKLLIQKQEPPPKPKPKEVPIQPEKPKPTETVADKPKEPVKKPEPVKQNTEQARKKASRAGLLPFAEELADLRSDDAVAAVVKDQPLTGVAGEAKRNERSMIASMAGTSSGGINTDSMSRNTGGSGLGGRDATEVGSPVEGFGSAEPDVQSGGDVPSRSREEIEMVFDQNKGAIYALYTRALRRDPGLQGKVVLSLTIEPSGEVSAVEVLSSELNNPELERKLVQRIKLFRFDAKDVARLTTTKPINFFPA